MPSPISPLASAVSSLVSRVSSAVSRLASSLRSAISRRPAPAKPQPAPSEFKIIGKRKKEVKGREITVLTKKGKARVRVSSLAGWFYHPHFKAYVKLTPKKRLTWERLPFPITKRGKAYAEELEILKKRGKGKKRMLSIPVKYFGKKYHFRKVRRFFAGQLHAVKAEQPFIILASFPAEFPPFVSVSDQEAYLTRTLSGVDEKTRLRVLDELKKHPEYAVITRRYIYALAFRKRRGVGKKLREMAEKELRRYKRAYLFERLPKDKQKMLTGVFIEAGIKFETPQFKGVRVKLIPLTKKPKIEMFKVIRSNIAPAHGGPFRYRITRRPRFAVYGGE